MLCMDERCKKNGKILNVFCPDCMEENIHNESDHKVLLLKENLKKIIEVAYT